MLGKHVLILIRNYAILEYKMYCSSDKNKQRIALRTRGGEDRRSPVVIPVQRACIRVDIPTSGETANVQFAVDAVKIGADR